jgi:magnesium-transporting ATPase (P-type)
MITGDHAETGLAIARAIGLVRHRPRVITGHELERLSDAQLRFVLEEPELVFARVSAEQKLRVVRALQQSGAIVAVTGDGVNDAPALKAADIGVAMGITGTDVAREAADVVLLDDNFASIVAAIEEGRGVFDNIRKFITYVLTSNVAELTPYLAFVLLRVPLPLTIIQVLAVDLGTDMLPGLGLGAERPESNVMARAPRSAQDRIIDRGLLIRAYLVFGAVEAAAGMTAYAFVLLQGGWTWGMSLAASSLLYRQATTACLTAIVVTQVANVFACRSETLAARFDAGLSNPVLLGGVIVEIILITLIDYTSIGQLVFGTAAISWGPWLVALPFAAGLVAIDALAKSASRNRVQPETASMGRLA